MSEWRKLTLGELIESGHADLQTGPFGTMLNSSEYVPSGIPVIAVQDIGNNRLIHDRFVFVSKATAKRLERYKVRYGDIIFGRKGAVDRRAIVKKSEEGWLQGSDCIRLRFNDDIDSSFVSYQFGSGFHKEWMLQNAGGATMPSLNQQILKLLPITLPPLSEQRAVTTVLASLDDKIDLLQRQNKTLEGLAQTLFRHWFVDYQFPDQSNNAYKENGGELIDTDIGTIPKNWKIVSLEEVTSRITDGSHFSPASVEIGYPMASVKDMHQWGINEESCRRISKLDFNELVRNDCRPLKNDVLIAKDGSYLKHVFVTPNDLDLVVLSSIAILRPSSLYHPLLLTSFLKLDSTRQAMENIVTGAVIPRIVLKDFRKFPLVLPPIDVQSKAVEIMEPIYQKCWSNISQIQTLEKLRDVLLPKLMSGEVRVRL